MVMTKKQMQRIEEKIKEIGNAAISTLIEKNRSYGGSALSPIRVFSKLDPEQAIRVRIDDKICRVLHGNENAFGEDALWDLVGYFILLLVVRELKKEGFYDEKNSAVSTSISAPYRMYED